MERHDMVTLERDIANLGRIASNSDLDTAKAIMETVRRMVARHGVDTENLDREIADIDAFIGNNF